MNSPLLEKSMDFATQIVLFYEDFSKSKKDTTIAPMPPYDEIVKSLYDKDLR